MHIVSVLKGVIHTNIRIFPTKVSSIWLTEKNILLTCFGTSKTSLESYNHRRQLIYHNNYISYKNLPAMGYQRDMKETDLTLTFR